MGSPIAQSAEVLEFCQKMWLRTHQSEETAVHNGPGEEYKCILQVVFEASPGLSTNLNETKKNYNLSSVYGHSHSSQEKTILCSQRLVRSATIQTQAGLEVRGMNDQCGRSISPVPHPRFCPGSRY